MSVFSGAMKGMQAWALGSGWAWVANSWSSESIEDNCALIMLLLYVAPP